MNTNNGNVPTFILLCPYFYPYLNKFLGLKEPALRIDEKMQGKWSILNLGIFYLIIN